MGLGPGAWGLGRRAWGLGRRAWGLGPGAEGLRDLTVIRCGGGSLAIATLIPDLSVAAAITATTTSTAASLFAAFTQLAVA